MDKTRHQIYKLQGEIEHLVMGIFDLEHFQDIETEKLGDLESWEDLAAIVREQLDLNLCGYHTGGSSLAMLTFEHLVENGEVLTYCEIMDQFLDLYYGKFENLVDLVNDYYNLRLAKE